jgi:predicted branched-subunit amino acid permease
VNQHLSESSHTSAGARAMAPMTLAYVPFAFAVGSAVAGSADPMAAWLATWTIYGGAAHLAVLDVLADGSGWVAAALVGVLVNARLTAYAAAMAPEWRSASLRRRALAGVLLSDAPWALTRAHDGDKQRFYLGASITLFVAWPAMVTLGVALGDSVSDLPVTGLLSAMTLGAVVVTQLRQRPLVAATAAASITAVTTTTLAAGPALAVAAAAGVVTGLVTERLS